MPMRIGRTGVWMVAAAVGAAAAFVALTARLHFDTFHHLAYGRDILRRGGFALEDPFLFPLAGLPSGAQPSWLGSLVIYLSWWLVGEAGPRILAAAVTAATFTLLFLDGAEDDRDLGGAALALLPVGLALAAARGRAVPRPEIFASLLLAATMYALRRAGQGRRWLLPALGMGVALWANLHQSVLSGLAVVGLFVAVNGALLLAGNTGRRFAEVGSARTLAGLALACIAGVALAGLVSPVGFAPFLSPLKVIADWTASVTGGASAGAIPVAGDTAAVLKTTIGELQPRAPGWLDPFDWLVALTGISFAAAGRRLRPWELAAAAVFATLAYRIQRFAPLAAIVLAPVAARNLRAGLARLGPAARRRARLVVPAAAGILLIAAAALAVYRFRREPVMASLAPARAADYLRAAGTPVRLFNTFHFGGYLEWLLDAKVYQDARGGLRGDEVQAGLLGPAARDAFADLDARYRFDALVIEYPEFDAATAAFLAGTAPGDDWAADRALWSLVAFDDGGLLYLRRDGALAALAARDEYRHARPAVPPGLGVADAAALRADLERSVREAPGCTRCLSALGYSDLAEGRLAEAEAAFARATAGPHLTRAQALFGLYVAAARRGDLLAAEGRLREVIEVVADPTGYRRELAMILARTGRPGEGLREIRKNLDGGRADPVDLQLGVELARAAGDDEAARALARRLPGG